MRKKNKQKFNALIFRAFVPLSALFLFLPNVEQVAAEELTDAYETSAYTETVSKELEDVELTEEETADSKEEVTSYIEEEQELLDNELLEESLDETLEETAVDQTTEDEETTEQTEAKQTEELPESEVEEASKEEFDQTDTYEEEASSVETENIEDVDEEESKDTDASEEDAVEDMAEENTAAKEADVQEMDEEQPKEMTASANGKTGDKVQVDRISGQNRYKNAAELSKSGWSSASTVILTNGENFTDSLTGSPLASLHNAPILLTRANGLPSETLAEIKRLKPKEVIILGGQQSVSNTVLETLRRNGFSIRRIGGRNRYVLAENIAKEVMAKEGKNRDAFLVSGEVFSDAMSIAPVAASKRLPIFLTKANGLHQTVINAIPNVNMWTIIGGHLTISENVQKNMNNLGAKTRRIEGRNRYDVNRNVINYYGSSSNHMYVASGEHFADATPASVLAARKNSSVLLVRNNNKANLKEQRDFANSKNVNKLTLIGGALTLSKETEEYFHNQNHLVFLDPGHGGWDSGAVGWVDGRQYTEKAINLQVSFKVRDLLLDKGYEVAMARTNDTHVSLTGRPQLANNLGADIFVSLHHNAMPNSTTTTGIETFYYKSASNYPPSASARPYHNVPARLAGSKRLADAIHGELIDHTGAYDRGVKRMAFVVLKEAHMPAVLLEYGFMSTPADLRVFTQNWYQNNLAQATVDGIERYFS